MGLTSEEARRRFEQYGPNATPETKFHPLLGLLKKFWAPVPWMLELTVMLEIVLGRLPEAVIIGILLLFNAALSLVQERRAQNALELLKRRLSVQARVLRDGRWQLVPAAGLVPGDFVHIRMGDLVPADLHIADGRVLLDQSALTGESLPVEVEAQQPAYAGAVVKRGEASGGVTATGARTYFGRTAELVGKAKTVSHLETVILAVVKYLVMMDAALAVLLLAYSRVAHLPYSEMIPFTLILLVASVPVALPATFTLATALGAMELAKSGVLTTRLSAIEEAAAMDVLCTDKTGTITENRLSVGAMLSFPPFSDDDVLRWGALASDEASQDPIDLAILDSAQARGTTEIATKRTQFIPFDPATKLSEAVVERDGALLRVLKGAPLAVAARAAAAEAWCGAVQQLAKEGARVLAVAVGPEGNMRMAGLLALEDPPRPDSKDLVASLRGLGVRVVMVTGDGEQTARAIAAKVGIGQRTCGAKELDQTSGAVDDCDIFAEVFPEQKFHLVTALQRAGHVVGMTGDGVNDAPALKQAEVGIAVSSATDVAKAAASLVLTSRGLTDMLSAVMASRRIYQRMLTYTLNKIIKTVEIALFLSLGVILTRSFIITPLLIVLLLFTNDFVTMSIATDTVAHSQSPDRWHVGTLARAGLILGSCILALSFSIFLAGRDWLGLPLGQLQTLVFLTLVFTGQGTVYLVRERRHFWKSMPGRWLLSSSVLDVALVSFLAVRGILMAAIDPRLILGVLAVCAVYLAALDFAKVKVLRHFRDAPSHREALS
ncbi:MAG TPA: plasma-membrane proton-efflux P-type ATPase [Candidatus Dormibacteraeota bacterium]|nr:plasma-membrane proton-efflux P-type ATPase [Candidatus Dormibacteraeota bacterium]